MCAIVVAMLVLPGLYAHSSSRPLSATLDIGTHRSTNRLLVGAVADISVSYVRGIPVTSMNVLEFTPIWTSEETPTPQVRLCGALHRSLAPFLHKNVRLTYASESPSRSTGCLRLISIEPWHDNSKWQTIAPLKPGIWSGNRSSSDKTPRHHSGSRYSGERREASPTAPSSE